MTDLKIEAGKCYRTRDGRKAYPSFRDTSHVWRGLVVGVDVNGREEVTVGAWTADGHDWDKPGTARNLISEWKEPREGEVWVAAFDDGLSARDGEVAYKTFPTEAQAQAEWFCGEKAFAIKRVTLTEGQGLDGEGSE